MNNKKKFNILRDQLTSVSLVINDSIKQIEESSLTIYPQNFILRLHIILNYSSAMYKNIHLYEDEELYDDIIYLMNTIVLYKNKYKKSSYAYKVMNSLLDIIKNTFNEL